MVTQRISSPRRLLTPAHGCLPEQPSHSTRATRFVAATRPSWKCTIRQRVSGSRRVRRGDRWCLSRKVGGLDLWQFRSPVSLTDDNSGDDRIGIVRDFWNQTGLCLTGSIVYTPPREIRSPASRPPHSPNHRQTERRNVVYMTLPTKPKDPGPAVDAKPAAAPPSQPAADDMPKPDWEKKVTPDTALLFRYSALTFNTFVMNLKG